MTDRVVRHRLRETSKLHLRRVLHRRGFALSRDPYANRLVRALRHCGVTTILDVGANVGQYAATVRSAGFDGRIISLEPLSTAHAALAARASRESRWQTLKAAAGAEPGTAEINVSANSYSSSIRPMAERHLRADPDSVVVGTEKVAVVTVAEVVKQHGVDPATCLVKVDTQGFEQAVLDGLGDLLPQMRAIQLELSFVELYRGQVLFEDLVERLRGSGFILWSLETGISDETGRLLQCDVLFLKKDDDD